MPWSVRKADDVYLRRSIYDPPKEIVAGFEPGCERQAERDRQGNGNEAAPNSCPCHMPLAPFR